MRKSKIKREQLVLLVIKLSALLILCLMLLNAWNVMAQSISEREGISKVTNLQEKVRQIYTSQIGIRETPSNSGPQVEKYLRYVGLKKGNPWCAAFVCWVFGEAGISNPRTGWSPGLFGERYVIWGRRGERGKVKVESAVPNACSHTIKTVRLLGRYACPPLAGVGGGFCTHKPQTPQSGDVFGLYFPEKGRIAHVGFVDEWEEGWVTTVEGNTNVQGSREGDGVYRKRRLVASIYKVARYVK